MRLYGYWRSSSTWRVRIGLELKGVDYDVAPVNLLHSEHQSEAHRARNPMAQVPALEVEHNGQRFMLHQSLPILEFVDETCEGPRLLPSDVVERQQARSLAEIVNSGVQPLQNLAVLKAVEGLGGDRVTWSVPWIDRGLRALDHVLGDRTFFFEGRPGFVEACVVPQLYNARRFQMDVAQYPALARCEAACLSLPAFQRSHPDAQPDAVRAGT